MVPRCGTEMTAERCRKGREEGGAEGGNGISHLLRIGDR